MPGHIGSEKNDHDTRDVGRPAHNLAKAAETLLGVLHTPGGEGAGGDHSQGEAKAEGTDHNKAQGRAFELQADQ